MELARLTYRVSRSWPREELYGLTSQARRAVVSVPSNIAEGQARNTTGEFLQALGTAKGSLAELETQLILAGDFGYLRTEDLGALLALAEEVSKMLHGLMQRLRSKN